MVLYLDCGGGGARLLSNSKDGTKAKLHFTVREFKKVQKLFLRREREREGGRERGEPLDFGNKSWARED